MKYRLGRCIIVAILALAVAAQTASAQFVGIQAGSQPIIIPAGSSLFLSTLGDSITQQSQNVETYPTLYQGTSSIFVDNEAVSGETCGFVLSTEVPRAIAAKAAHSGYTNYFASSLCGVNDLGNPTYFDPTTPTTLAISAQNLVNVMANIANALHAGGFTKVAIATLTDFNGKGENGEIWLREVQADIYALYPGTIDGVIDFTALPMSGNGVCLDKFYYRDCIHPQMPGQFQMEGQEFGIVINSFLAGNVAPNVPTAITQQPSYVKSNSIVLNWAKPGQTNTSGGYFSDFTTQYKVHNLIGAYTTYSHAASRIPQALINGLAPSTAYDVRIQVVGPGGNSQFVYFTTAATPSLTPDTLDPSAFYTNAPACALSNGNMTVGVTGNVTGLAAEIGCTIRTNVGQSSGKWYNELHVNAVGASQPGIGICDSNYPLNLPFDPYLGAFANSAGNNGSNYVDGFTLVNAPDVTFGTGDYAMLAFDLGAQKAWLGKNGTWAASGNPATGANPTWIWTTIVPPLFLCTSLDYTSQSVTYSGATTHYSPPAGFSVL